MTGPPLRRLFSPGERLGWRFRDRLRFMRPFPEPAPERTGPPPQALRRHQSARRRFGFRLLAVVAGWLGATVGLLCVGAAVSVVSLSTANWLYALAGVAFVAGLGAVALVVFWHTRTVRELPLAHRRGAEELARARADWERRRAAFERAERDRVDDLLEWGAVTVPPGTRRVDVVGGTLWGWEAFLTVFGSSALATRGSLTVLDLTGEAVFAELAELAGRHGTTVDVQRLPSGLADSDLLVGLDRQQLVDTLVEAMAAEGGGDARDERSLDSRLLAAICEVIAPDLRLARVAAAVRVVMGEPGETRELTDAERDRLAGLFSESYRRSVHDRLRRVEAYLHPLRDLGARRAPRPEAALSCLALDSDVRTARGDLLVDLMVGWVSRRTLGPQPPRTLVVVGADDLPRRHLERLADICGRRDVRLVYLFRHLRAASTQLIGGGAVAFMRLGNHEEAARAADFIGRHHRFVLTQVTRTLGGEETHGGGETEGREESETAVRDLTGPARIGQRRRGVSRQWATTRSWAESTNWSDAASQQRVYEYAVEPTTLQHLPDYAMLLVESRPSGPVVHAVECDPAILTLPRATHEPLPELIPAQRSGPVALPGVTDRAAG